MFVPTLYFPTQLIFQVLLTIYHSIWRPLIRCRSYLNSLKHDNPTSEISNKPLSLSLSELFETRQLPHPKYRSLKISRKRHPLSPPPLYSHKRHVIQSCVGLYKYPPNQGLTFLTLSLTSLWLSGEVGGFSPLSTLPPLPPPAHILTYNSSPSLRVPTTWASFPTDLDGSRRCLLWIDPPRDGKGFRDFYHNRTNYILQQMKRKFWKISGALFRISWMTNSFK